MAQHTDPGGMAEGPSAESSGLGWAGGMAAWR